MKYNCQSFGKWKAFQFYIYCGFCLIYKNYISLNITFILSFPVMVYTVPVRIVGSPVFR